MTREQMIDQAVRHSTSLGDRAAIAALCIGGAPFWSDPFAAMRAIRAEFRRIATAERCPYKNELCPIC